MTSAADQAKSRVIGLMGGLQRGSLWEAHDEEVFAEIDDDVALGGFSRDVSGGDPDGG
jgi:hypothetical protein